jgi:hypothetical protein
MEMPRSTAEHERLRAFVGAWKGEETCHPSPWDPTGGSARGTFTYSLGPGGLFLLSDYQQVRAGVPDFSGHGVYGWDAAAGRYTMDWFDSMGGRVVAQGDWIEGGLVFAHRSPVTHARYVHRVVDGRYHFRLELSPDGTVYRPMLEGVYARG